MEINFRRVGIVLVLANIGGLFLVPRIAQSEAKERESKGRVVLSKLFPPNYPPLARQAHIFGDVHLKVSIHSDGNINSVTVIDGPPMLRQAALDSARQSRFDCEHCEGSGTVERIFAYSFQIPGAEKPLDSNCCLEEQASPDKPPTPVSQSDDLVIITAPAVCWCSDEYLGTLMDRRMRLIAGNDALDCGRVKLNGDPKPSLRCARKAISHRRAFVVRFDYAGMDSSISDGFASDGSGKVYSVRFDSMGWGQAPGIEILDGTHDAVEICPKPVRIKARSAPIGAFWGYRCIPEEK
jgi:TonB family protein